MAAERFWLFITRGMPLAEGTDLDEIARTTYGFVGADLGALVREAAMDALRRILPNINLREGIPAEVLEKLSVGQGDFLSAMKRIQPSALREIMIQAPECSLGRRRWPGRGRRLS